MLVVVRFLSVLGMFTARKRSLGQGNMFTDVYLSAGGVPAPSGLPSPGGGAWSGGVWSRGCLVPGGVPAPRGGVWSRGVPDGDPPDGYCCGWYASYWNAFLFGNNLTQLNYS